MDHSEYDLRLAERYRLLWQQQGEFSEGLAGYLTGGGLLMAISGLFLNAGNTGDDPAWVAGLGVATFVGAGGFWIFIRSRAKRIHQEIASIEKHFRQKNMRVDYTGDIRSA